MQKLTLMMAYLSDKPVIVLDEPTAGQDAESLERCAALIRESVEDMDVSRESVVLKLLEIYQRCMAAVPVLEWNSDTQSWEESGGWRFDARGAAKALEQLTKLLGLDAPVKLDAGGDGLEALLGALQGEKIY